MWRHTGGRGRDVVCLILRAARPVGVLRLTHPETRFSVPVSAGLPFVSLAAEEKIQREWDAYTTGFPMGLTPEPLWRDNRALLCAYVDAQPIKRELESGAGVSPLTLTAEVLPHIARLHEAGLAHMDMSLSNILRDASKGKLLFVDFEYGAAAGLTFEQQCLYDYLRLLESVWKFLSPSEHLSAAGTWGGAFFATAPAAVRAAEIAPLRPAISRLLAAPEMRDFFGKLTVR